MDQWKEMVIKAAGQSTVAVDEPMKNHTSFKIGGTCDLLISPDTVQDLQSVLKILKKTNTPYLIMGNGSNLLIKDSGFRGVVIKLCESFKGIEIQGTQIKADSGVLLSFLAQQAMKQGLSGLEFASGIPGTLGGAVFMNAGAYGGEMSQVVETVTVLNQKDEIEVLTKKQLAFSYPSSLIQKQGMIVLSATLSLEEGDQETIANRMADYSARRRAKQPLELPSAGSTFKRPQGYFAGKLIQDAGLSGFRIGGACISEKHAGFVVNLGEATAKDVLAVIDHCQKTVLEKFGVLLEPEVRILGE